MTPYDSNDALIEFETVLLERIKFYVSQSFDTTMIETMQYTVTMADEIARRLVLDFRAELWSEKLPPATYKTERVVDCMHYATWFDHLISTIGDSRFSWLTRWLRSPRFENRPKSVTVEVELSPRYVYPQPGFKAQPACRWHEVHVRRSDR